MEAEKDGCLRKERHKKLAGFVKQVHNKLRRDLLRSELGFDEVWANHLQQSDVLEEYAEAMAELSQDHWSLRPETRIDWCYATCKEFFFQGGLLQQLHKDQRRRKYSQRQTSDWEVAGRLSVSEASDVDSGGSSPARTASAQCIRDLGLLQRSKSHEDAHSVRRQLLLSTGAMLGTSAPAARPPCLLGPPAVTYSGRIAIPTHPSPVLLSPADSTDTAESLDSAGALQKHIRQQGSDLPVFSCSPASGVGNAFSSCDSAADYVNGLSQIEAEVEQQRLQQTFCTRHTPDHIEYPFCGKIRLLDVGSCHNPFKHLPEFVSVAVDICPSKNSPDVLTGDFLSLEITEGLRLAGDSFESYLRGLGTRVNSLPKQSFHVVVFSLLLEYFPAAYQRWRCCYKAHQLLMTHGLLLIVTPDSSAAHKNSAQMKAWKLCIEALGFSRWRYMKQEHLHCMAFRKITADTQEPGLSPEADPANMYIPQDGRNSPARWCDVGLELDETYSADSNYHGLCELPYCDDE